MTPTTLTIDRLSVDPLNVRTNQEDATSTDALQASILARGLMLPLLVRPLKKPKGSYGAFAGGRRLRAIEALVARGDLPADWPVAVVVHEGLTDQEIVERSTAENMLRRSLREYELYAAFADAHARGATIADLAREFGQRPLWVEQVIRVASLAPEVFAQFAEGKLSLDQARAFAAVEDHEQQRHALGVISAPGSYDRSPGAIRRAMKVGDRDQSVRLAFVGEDAYRAAGGRYTLDLFAAESELRGRVEDEDLLARLFSERLAEFRSAQRAIAADGGAVRPIVFAAQPPQTNYGGTDWNLGVRVVRAALDGFDQAEFDAAQDEAVELEHFRDALVNDDGDVPADREAEYAKADAALDAQLAKCDAIAARAPWALPEGEIVATIAIEADGEPALSWWFADAKAQKAAQRGRPSGGAALETRNDLGTGKRDADAAANEDYGLSQDAVETMRSLSRQLLRALLVENAVDGDAVGQDFLIWSLARSAILSRGSRHLLGTVGLAPLEGNPLAIADRLTGTLAQGIFEEATRQVAAADFMTLEDPGAAFRAFRAAPPSARQLAAAVVAGLSLTRTANLDGYRLPVHAVLAADCGAVDPATLRRTWSPTPEFLAMLPRKARLAIAAPFLDPPTLARWGKLKSAELTTALWGLLTSPGGECRPDARDAARAWVHPALTFSAYAEEPPLPAFLADPDDDEDEPADADLALEGALS